VGDKVCARIDGDYREAIARNHSVAHLLQAALRAVLGTHVEQAGSLVDSEKCRFDFTHFSAMTADEVAKVETLVNAHIFAGLPISMTEMPLDEAKKLGAMALFGEKYGKTVRVVRMGNFSTELCGGTHCDNTGKIGLFKIISESSVAAGVRRIEAVTGLGVLALIASKDALINSAASELKVPNPTDIAKRASQLQSELHSAKKEIEALNAKLASSKLGDILAGAKQVGSVKLIASKLSDMQLDAARALADDIKANHADTVAVLAVASADKLNFIAVAGKDAVAAGAHAGKLVGAVASATGGKGGGRPDSAMAGGKDTSKIDEALALAESTLASMLK
jgi:alanyl-tRNA synthetase